MSCGGSQGNSPHWAGGDVEPQEQVQGHQTLERPAREKESQYSHGSPDNVNQEVFKEERDPIYFVTSYCSNKYCTVMILVL